MARIAIIGFGEVGGILAQDFATAGAQVAAFDVSAAAQARAHQAGLAAPDAPAACQGADMVFVCVTAGSALDAMRSLDGALGHAPFVIDVNSVAPATKQRAAALIEQSGGRYVEAAVMASIAPKRLRVPILLGGPRAAAFMAAAAPFGMDLTLFSAEIGRASSVKMCRSVMIKGLEALATECMLAARHYGVEYDVLRTLTETLPHPNWPGLARHMISRPLVHGKRRAEEMREVAVTVQDAGVEPMLSQAIAARQDWAWQRGLAMGDKRDAPDLDALLDALDRRAAPAARRGMIRRRAVLAAGAMALAAPAIARPAQVLRFVPNVDLPVLDPIANTAAQVLNHAFLIFDTLYGVGFDYKPAPQMLAGHVVEPDGLLWTLRLRDGLRFHDGTQVLARDCVASIRRWAAVDGFGQTLLAATASLNAPDDRTIRFRLARPFPLLPDALGHMSPNICAIMPERLASQPASKPLAEIVGSGPFALVAAERVPGSRIVYERFADYVPADGPPGFTSGGKRAELDRVEWLIMPEPASAIAALQTGEVDWLEAPPPDLLPLLRQDRNVRVTINDKTGVVPILRFNMLYPPFDNLAIRQALLGAVQQQAFMEAFSSDPLNYRTGVGVFAPGTPMASDVGLRDTLGTLSLDDARRAIAAAGYKGERVVLLEPTDHPVNAVMAQLGADLFKKAGLHVDDQAMDAATMFQRRGNRQDLDHGGWSCFPSAVAGIDVLNPAVSFLTRGNGAKAWYGWPDDPALEALRLSWFQAPTQAGQRMVAEAIQRQVLQQAPYLPLGQILQPTAYRTGLSAILPGFAKFWSVRKAIG